MTRAEHLQWCKQRALEYVDAGDLPQAMASMASDVMKHPDTAHHAMTNQLGLMQLMSGTIRTQEQMRKWIEGYN